ncbi:hypothetical protein SFRURICE_013606 [Spodoptera frugiperda]|nr:hypothetical protein SFRURICE_013606 [Spodoptera frugiperda]
MRLAIVALLLIDASCVALALVETDSTKLCFIYGKMCAIDGFPTIDISHTGAAPLLRTATLRRRIFTAHLTHTHLHEAVNQTRNNNLWMTQRVASCGSRTRYTLRGSRLPSYRGNHSIKYTIAFSTSYSGQKRQARHNLPHCCDACKPGSKVDPTMKTPEHRSPARPRDMNETKMKTTVSTSLASFIMTSKVILMGFCSFLEPFICTPGMETRYFRIRVATAVFIDIIACTVNLSASFIMTSKVILMGFCSFLDPFICAPGMETRYFWIRVATAVLIDIIAY